ncbi:dTMP kinase [Lactobacillus mulieris]|uniref:dTMP kinase n=1 Tax=Lactobacillus mulieris TaxID=2508708 RepID=UPI00143291FC|nr:dTMP kinase [Lactobacillus mulieris]MCF1783049.1 dTMP kinase [Lactobacillus mulieris]MCW8104594.1 dTMP kinase [Lactobacillus mulieris]MDK6803444.1 dTMP kinase [Lactobacillus mulieris]MDK8382417.1 dTMP kinase [Lactobacillus mulieris]MDT9620744.1 dTMP kinase [Lactobacillus mulieris]
MAGYFITFEGPDGAGKTTVLEKLVEEIKKKVTCEILVTREPGGSKIAEAIRDIILNPENTEMDDRTEALLYAAARSQHMAEVVFPALEAGKLVFSDRFVDSSLAYQGMGRNLGIEKVAEINQFATDGLNPNLTLFLDIDPKAGLARIAKVRPDKEDRLEKEKLSFHQKVYTGYQEIAKRYPERIKVVDASQDVDQVVADCLAILKQQLPDLFEVK